MKSTDENNPDIFTTLEGLNSKNVTSQMMEEANELTFLEHVRKRPAMFLGFRKEGVLNLMRGIILDSIAICKTNQLFITISLSNDNSFLLEIKSERGISELVAVSER